MPGLFRSRRKIAYPSKSMRAVRKKRQVVVDPTLRVERRFWRDGLTRIVGIDECGVAALSGPVVACALYMPINCRKIPGVRDSKMLSRAERERLADLICAKAVRVGIGAASAREIERLNILRATHLAMKRALERVGDCDHSLIDGLPIRDVDMGPNTCIVRGDATAYSIAAASIVGKVCRDRLMAKLAVRYPGYGWEHNAGLSNARSSSSHSPPRYHAASPKKFRHGPHAEPAHARFRRSGKRIRSSRRSSRTLATRLSPNGARRRAQSARIPTGMRMDRRTVGQYGERLAEHYLIGQGAKLLARNYRIPFGEIDLVVEHEGELVAVEVKARAIDALEQPEEAVNWRKLRRIVQALTAYALDTDLMEMSWRIDVVAIQLELDGTMCRLDHLRSVYPA